MNRQKILALGALQVLPPTYLHFNSEKYKRGPGFITDLVNYFTPKQKESSRFDQIDPIKYIINPKNGQEYKYVKYLNREGLTIFSRVTCPYCSYLKAMLNDMGVDYETIDSKDMPRDVVLELCEVTDCFTIPKLFIKDRFYDGYGENLQRRKDGTLKGIFDNNGIKYEKA